MSSKIYHYALVTRIAVNYQMIQNFIKFYLDLLSLLDRKNNVLIIVEEGGGSGRACILSKIKDYYKGFQFQRISKIYDSSSLNLCVLLIVLCFCRMFIAICVISKLGEQQVVSISKIYFVQE